MTLDDMEKALWGAGAAAIAGLMALVRGGDVKRLDAIEGKQRELEERHRDMEVAAEAGRDRIYAEIHSLRDKVDTNHTQLVALLLEGRK